MDVLYGQPPLGRCTSFSEDASSKGSLMSSVAKYLNCSLWLICFCGPTVGLDSANAVAADQAPAPNPSAQRLKKLQHYQVAYQAWQAENETLEKLKDSAAFDKDEQTVKDFCKAKGLNDFAAVQKRVRLRWHLLQGRPSQSGPSVSFQSAKDQDLEYCYECYVTKLRMAEVERQSALVNRLNQDLDLARESLR